MQGKKRIIFWSLFGFAIFLVIVAVSVVLTYGPPDTHVEVLPADFDHCFSPATLRADLDFMMGTLEQVHPDLYFGTNKNTIAAMKDSLAGQLRQPVTRVQFYPIVARLAASFGDGHTYAIYPWEEWRHFKENGGLIFPFTIKKENRAGLTVTKIYESDSPLHAGDLLMRINGHDADSLFQSFLQIASGEKRSFRQALIQRRFALFLWLSGISSPFHIRFKTPLAAEVKNAVAEGVTREVLDRHQADAAVKFYSYRLLPERIGLIDFRAMRDLEAFEDFLATTFEQIRRDSTRGLIIDLRNNGGGSTELGSALLSYLTDKPFRFAARMEWKVSPQLKQYLKGFVPAWLGWLPLQYFHPMARKIWTTPEGQMAVWEFAPESHAAKDWRFTGPVCVLIGPRTFSSAMKLANVCKDFDLATLIGEETGGNPNAFGEVYRFDLPNTRLQIGVSTKRFTRANGDAQYRGGVRPHIEVQQSDSDLQNGVDTVLEFARKWCFKASRTGA